MKKVFVLPALCCMLLTAGTALAANPLYLGIQLGPEFITDDDSGLDDAVAFGVYGGYRLDYLLSLELSLTSASHDADHHSDVELDNTALLFGPRLNAGVGRGATLYAGAGLGIYFFELDTPVGDDDETETGLYLGAGMEFPIQSNVKLGLDFKYHAMFDSDDSIDSDLLTLMFRVGFDI